MQLRPARVVRVTNEQDLNAALDSADQVIVEGDDRLLSYAVKKAAHDPQNDIAIEAAMAPIPSFPSAPAQAGAPRRGLKIIAVALPVIVLLLAGGMFLLSGKPTSSSFSLNAPSPQALEEGVAPRADKHEEERHVAPPAQPIEPAPVASDRESALLETVTWPAVAIVAILALFLIARQAIAGGRNVEISWKVTEKVSGRVVITKVRTPPKRGHAAAA